MGKITRELHRVKDLSLSELYYYIPRTRKYGRLSKEAKRVMHCASLSITGMYLGPNEYWLPEIMSEAIEAAEALKL